MDPVTFIIVIVALLAAIYISEANRAVPEDVRPAGLGDIDITTADSTRRVPVIWGMPINKGPNIVWYGNLVAYAVKKEIDGLFVDDEYTIGHQYFMGMHFVPSMGGPNAVLLKIWAGEELFMDGVYGRVEHIVQEEDLFGGIQFGTGGLVGRISVYPGFRGQGVCPYLQRMLGFRVPEYHNVFSVIAEDMYFGSSKFLKMWQFQVRRNPSGLGTGFHDIDGEANPAEMIYECLVNADWGMTINDGLIDKATFAAAAQKLWEEGMGMSLVWDGGMNMETIIKHILNHIDAVLFVNSITGKFTLRLLRAPTQLEIDNLPIINNSKCKRVKYSRPGIDELVNEIKVIISDLENRNETIVHAQELGLYNALDKQIISATVEYKGFTKPELAMRCAERDLRTLSYPLAMVILEDVNREFYSLTPGAKFKYTDEELGINEIIMSVLDIDYGSLRKNKIAIDAVQDVFSLGDAIYNSLPDDTLFDPIDYSAKQVDESYVTGMPYWFNKISPALAITGSYDTDIKNLQKRSFFRPLILAKDPTKNSMGIRLHYSVDGGVTWKEDKTPRKLCPTGELLYDYGRTLPSGKDDEGRLQDMVIKPYSLNLTAIMEDAISPVTSDKQIVDNAENLIIINGEIMGLHSFNILDTEDGKVLRGTQVWRGLSDTPKQHLHPAGSTVYFISMGNATTGRDFFYGLSDVEVTTTPYGVPSELWLKLSTQALKGALKRDDTNVIITENDGRAYAPHAPGNLRINGIPSGEETFIAQGDDILIEWNHRSRWEQKGEKEDSTVVSPTTNGETTYATVSNWYYEVRIYDGAGTLKHTETPVSGQSFLFTKSVEDGLSFDYSGALRIEVTIIREDEFPTSGGTVTDLVESYFDSVLYIHREPVAPVGHYMDMLMGSAPKGIWGFEE